MLLSAALGFVSLHLVVSLLCFPLTLFSFFLVLCFPCPFSSSRRSFFRRSAPVRRVERRVHADARGHRQILREDQQQNHCAAIKQTTSTAPTSRPDARSIRRFRGAHGSCVGAGPLLKRHAAARCFPLLTLLVHSQVSRTAALGSRHLQARTQFL